MRISNGIQNRNRRMPNGTYGGVRGRKTKVGRKLLRFPPTRLFLQPCFKAILNCLLVFLKPDYSCQTFIKIKGLGYFLLLTLMVGQLVRSP